jgi:TetR/AcrR family transcriptional regulator, transcriptional repressor for nem operon
MSKKQEIITIAKEIIHSKGYQATSISDILHAASIGKGQFYYYFSSKHDLGLAVVEELIQEWDKQLLVDIFKSPSEPKSKLNNMLNWAIAYHAGMDNKSGCPIGNLAIEMSEHDETFRLKIKGFIERWIGAVQTALDQMVNENQLDSRIDTKKSAEMIVATIEGGILLMKNQLNIQVLINVIDMIRKQFCLSK